MSRRPESFLATVRRETRARDVLALLLVPAALTGIYLLPDGIRFRFALAYAHPTPLSLYLANFTHLTLEHLLSNLVGYLFVAPIAFVLCALADRKRMFWAVFTVYLTVFPFILSLLNVELSRNTARIGLGFSGVLAAFFGFLPVALLWYTRRRFTGDVALQHAPLCFFTGVGILSLLALPVGQVAYAIAALAILGIAISGHRLLADLRELSVDGFKHAASPAGYLEFAAIGLVLFFGFPFAAFPSVSIHNGQFTNLFLHLVGYSLGYLVPYMAFAIVNPNTSTVRTHTT